MTTIYLLRVSNLRTIVHLAAEHAVFGETFDTGTYAPLIDVFDEPLTEVTRICQEIDGGRALLRAEPAEEAGFNRERLEKEAAAHPLGLIFAETARDDLPALALFCGPGLPIMGAQPECDPARLRATMRELIGDPAEEGVDSLFSEPYLAPSLFEERLNDRLRQLYGE
jgi:hypothetical protein